MDADTVRYYDHAVVACGTEYLIWWRDAAFQASLLLTGNVKLPRWLVFVPFHPPVYIVATSRWCTQRIRFSLRLYVADIVSTARAFICDMRLPSRGRTTRLEADASNRPRQTTNRSAIVAGTQDPALCASCNTHLPCTPKSCAYTRVVHLVSREVSNQHVLLIE